MLVACRRPRRDVVAEGVETEAQRAWLRRAGVSHPQRYLFGRPMPLADLLHRFPPRTG